MRRFFKQEKGEIMLEGMIIMVLTMLLLIWILGIGFIYYQRFLVTSVTNDAATKIAATYRNPQSDIIMGYIEAEDLAQRDLYRNFQDSFSSLREVNENKAKAYIHYMLERTNFAGTVDGDTLDVQLRIVSDSVLRKHIEVKTTCTFNTPFGSGLEIFGMNSKVTYEAVARAECTDIIDYVSTCDFAAYQLSGSWVGKSKVLGIIKPLISIFNRVYFEKY